MAYICNYLNKSAPLLPSSHGGQQPFPIVSSNPDSSSSSLVSPRLKVDSTPVSGPHTSQANWTSSASAESIMVDNTSKGDKNPFLLKFSCYDLCSLRSGIVRTRVSRW